MASSASRPPVPSYETPAVARESFVVRFAGDAGDGMTFAGLRFSAAAAEAGNDVFTYVIPPLEIRAPAGAVTAVSAYQVHFGSRPLHTPGDAVDILLAMNPAALKLHLPDLAEGGLVIVNSDSFDAAELEKARYPSNPLEGDALAGRRVLKVPIHRLNREATAAVKLLSPREADRSRNLFALGLACWLCHQPTAGIVRWIQTKFARNPAIVDANTRALNAGVEYGKHLGPDVVRVEVPPASRTPGRYRRFTGNEALALGLAAACDRLGRPAIFASAPMTPATDLQQSFRDLAACGIETVEAEDEMAAAGIALGASFAGGVGVTVTAGPGLCLMGEILGLAVAAELPLVVIDVMRAGPGGGVPTASEQGDLLQAMHGRNGDSPVIVLAPTSPADSYATAVRAVQLAAAAMTPVIVLTDLHIGLAAQIGPVPDLRDIVDAPRVEEAPAWIAAGTPGGEHRQSGLEKDRVTGHVSADPINHDAMVSRRIAKIHRLADLVPPAEVVGADRGDILVVGWGSVAGTLRAAASECQRQGFPVSAALVSSLHPLPANLGPLVRGFRKVIVAELNRGQLASILRSRFGVETIECHKTQGQPFSVAELVAILENHRCPEPKRRRR